MGQSFLQLVAEQDARRLAEPPPPHAQAPVNALFEAARRDWLASRATFGDQFDATFNAYVGRRAGLPETDERSLALECAKFFRQKREDAEKAVVREVEIATERQHAQRNAMAADGVRMDWVERELAAFLRVAGDLREVADAIEAAKGTRPVSAFMPGQPPVADDAAIVALCERLRTRLDAAQAVIRLTSDDAKRRMKLEKKS